ncbi:hypothetical protein DFH05DRAFT_1520029 [Lentinula detonsa]|uniref:Uncharacterized protein n=1 Tax=Lentinula detonsa TaxID=2804962 RepID=A0A9W8U0X0_9AGAR|nr:hypothetical protein DFH05DRAFT_1520029 [Lentinula detonsa]KAJ3980217.1 hypothetical protein F5890DRAFT_1557893 [Lentinula detonsa]
MSGRVQVWHQHADPTNARYGLSAMNRRSSSGRGFAAFVTFSPGGSGVLRRRTEVSHTSDGKNTDVRIHVRRYNPISKALYDPFLRYPHLLAKSYSTSLNAQVDVIDLDDVIAHAARYDYSHGRSVLVNMSRA